MKLKGTGHLFKDSNNDNFEIITKDGYTELINKSGPEKGDRVMYENGVMELYEQSITNLEVKGDILLVGLGHGMLYYNWKDLPGVKSITAIEIEQDIIDLVKPIFPNMRYICADALEYTTNDIYDTIFLDIFHKKVSGYEETQSKLINNYKRFIRNWRNVKDFKKCISYLHINRINLDYLL